MLMCLINTIFNKGKISYDDKIYKRIFNKKVKLKYNMPLLIKK